MTFILLRLAPRTCFPIALVFALFGISIFLDFATKVKAVSTTIVISQVYGGGGNAGATYTNDFIELFNRGNSPVNVNGWSVQYGSSGGTTWSVTNLTDVTIQPGQYYLVQEAAGAGGTTPLPLPDATGSIAMSATAAKVALVSNTTVLSGACPTGADIVDLVGYGAANCSEGSTAPTLTNTTAGIRAANGCVDTDNNSADFGTAAPNPRNTSSPLNDCDSVTPTPTPTPSPSPTPTPGCTVTNTVAQIQGNGNASPLAGSSVTTNGIVTGLRSNGFFIQMPAPADNDASTSDGIFVFTSSAPPSAATIGNSVCVSGQVQEFIPSADPNSPPLTEIGFATVIALSTGNALPAPVTLTTSDTNVNDLNNLEKYEGMRVHIDSLTVVAPTQGNLSEANATSTSNGVFYGVITGTPRPFREPGIQVPDPIPTPTPNPNNIPRFDGNPERIRVDSDAQPGSTLINVTTGAVVTNLTGPLDYSFRTYTILPDAATTPDASGNISAIPVPLPAANQFTVASFNMERFFDTVNDPSTSDVVLTTTAFNNRLNKASLAIRNIMRSPDIIGVEEMENLATLQAVATKINNDAVAAGDPNPNYQAFLIEGNDIGGIDVGFLVKTPKINVIDVTQFSKDTTYIDPTTGQPALLNDRPPLVLRAMIQAPVGSTFPITVIVNHLRSLSGVDDTVDGNRVRAKRRAQAEDLADLIQARQLADPTEHIVSVGDYNAFQFNDGYVDVIGTIKGVPTPADQVTLASGDLVNPDLTDLVDLAPADQRYSFSFDGNAQELDHLLITTNMSSRFDALNYARNDTDFPEVYRNDPNRPERISDHDMPIAYFNFPEQPVITASGSSLVNESCRPFNGAIDPGERVTVNLQLTNSGNTGTSNLVATLQTSGGVVAPSDAQNFGTIVPNSSAARDFSFTATGSCGGSITATLQLQDGAENLGTVTYSFPLGVDTGSGFVCSNACGGGVRLIVTSNVSRLSSSTVQANITLQNIGADVANSVMLTTAKLGSTKGTPLPQNLGNLAAGSSVSAMVTFANSAPGASATLIVRGSYDEGRFNSTKRITIP